MFRRFSIALLLLLGLFSSGIEAAVYTYVPSGGWQVVAVNATSTAEDTYIVSSASTSSAPIYLQITPTGAALFFASTAGTSQTAGAPLQINQTFTWTIPRGTGLTFYASAQSGTGSLALVVVQ